MRFWTISLVFCDRQVSNSEFKRIVLGKCSKSIDKLVDHCQLRWSEHVLRTSKYQRPQCAMMVDVGADWEKADRGRTKTTKLSYLDRYNRPGWGPCNYHNQWLPTLNDMAQNCSQWYKFMDFFRSLIPKFLNFLRLFISLIYIFLSCIFDA